MFIFCASDRWWKKLQIKQPCEGKNTSSTHWQWCTYSYSYQSSYWKVWPHTGVMLNLQNPCYLPLSQGEKDGQWNVEALEHDLTVNVIACEFPDCGSPCKLGSTWCCQFAGDDVSNLHLAWNMQSRGSVHCFYTASNSSFIFYIVQVLWTLVLIQVS